MTNCDASKQNFDSEYTHKADEREGSVQVIRQTERGLLSIKTNELPNVARYFLKNDNDGVCFSQSFIRWT